MSILRKNKTQKSYNRFMERRVGMEQKYCFMCAKEMNVWESEYFVILKNRFPYDKLAEIHHIICPKRHTRILNKKEIRELKIILMVLRRKSYFDCLVENFEKNKSYKNHWHIHLIKYLRNEKI